MNKVEVVEEVEKKVEYANGDLFTHKECEGVYMLFYQWRAGVGIYWRMINLENGSLYHNGSKDVEDVVRGMKKLEVERNRRERVCKGL